MRGDMLIIYIVYMLIILALLCINAIIDWQVLNGGNVCQSINAKRITLPILTLMFMFLIVITESIISQIYYVFSDGFVNNTAIIIGIISVVYICDYAYAQYKLRNYNLVQFNIDYNKFLFNSKENLKIAFGRPYLLKNMTFNFNEDLPEIMLDDSEYVRNRFGIGGNECYTPPEYKPINHDDKIEITKTDRIKKVADESEIGIINKIDKNNSVKKINANKSTFIIKKSLVFSLFIVCFVLGILIQIIKIEI